MLKKILKKIALPVQPPLSCEQGHHEVAIFFILSSRILSSETSTGGLDADGSGLATVGILMSDWGEKKKIHQMHYKLHTFHLRTWKQKFPSRIHFVTNPHPHASTHRCTEYMPKHACTHAHDVHASPPARTYMKRKRCFGMNVGSKIAYGSMNVRLKQTRSTTK